MSTQIHNPELDPNGPQPYEVPIPEPEELIERANKLVERSASTSPTTNKNAACTLKCWS